MCKLCEHGGFLQSQSHIHSPTQPLSMHRSEDKQTNKQNYHTHWTPIRVIVKKTMQHNHNRNFAPYTLSFLLMFCYFLVIII